MLKPQLLLIYLFLSSWLSAKDLALLIGNEEYQHCQTLDNPVNDVKLISQRLVAGGYKVTPVKNGKLKDMTMALARFCEQAKGANKIVFFYAGHGIEVGGQNYLIPVDAKLEKKGDQKWESLPLNKVLNELTATGVKVKVIVLDCCRDDPFSQSRSWRKTRSTGKSGMAAVNANQLSRGTIIAYSGKPGATVPDGKKGGNSPFTIAFNKELIRANGKSIMDVFSDMGDFLPASNKHWVKIDSDGESLASLNRTTLLNGKKKPGPTPNNPTGQTAELPPRAVVAAIPPDFIHHRQDKHVSFYKGKYEGDDAYFALSWHDPGKFSGYCFLHEGNTIYYVQGAQAEQGKMHMSVWHQGRKIRFIRMKKDAQSEDISWLGKSNLGPVSFSRKRVKAKPSTAKSKYKGALGVNDVDASIEWPTSIDVKGRLEVKGSNTYRLIGNNSINGTIYANLYSNSGHSGVVILKRSNFQGISWSGKCHFNNGSKVMLSVKR